MRRTTGGGGSWRVPRQPHRGTPRRSAHHRACSSGTIELGGGRGLGQNLAPAEAWDAIAAGYDELVAPGEVEVAQAALRLAGLRAGHRFLDVAAGPGALSLPAARLGAQVLATDWSPAMIELFVGALSVRRRSEGADHAVRPAALNIGVGTS